MLIETFNDHLAYLLKVQWIQWLRGVWPIRKAVFLGDDILVANDASENPRLSPLSCHQFLLGESVPTHRFWWKENPANSPVES